MANEGGEKYGWKVSWKILNKIDLLSEGLDSLSKRFNSLQTNIIGEISGIKSNVEELKANQIVMQYEISDLKTGQAIMQDEIKSIKRGQTVIIRSVTQMKKDIIGLKHIVKHLDERIDAVLMDVETMDEKTEELKIVRWFKKSKKLKTTKGVRFLVHIKIY